MTRINKHWKRDRFRDKAYEVLCEADSPLLALDLCDKVRKAKGPDIHHGAVKSYLGGDERFKIIKTSPQRFTVADRSCQ